MAEAARHRGEFGGITSDEDLEHYLRLIGRIDLAIEANETSYNVEKQRLKDQYYSHKAELKAQREPLLAAVETYVTPHRDRLLGKKKSTQLNFGKIGWRKDQDDIAGFPKKGTPEMAALVDRFEDEQEKDPEAYNSVPVLMQKWIEKSAVNKLAAAAVRAIGLIKTYGGDRFFVEADREKLQEVPND